MLEPVAVTSRTTPRAALAFPALLALAALAACSRAPKGEALPEWTAADHDQSDKPAANAGARGRKVAGGGDAGLPGVGDVAWQAQCVTCHGVGGKGDGPQGPMLKATDLTAEAWQAKVSDAEIAQAITQGKNGRMPKFDLPPPVVDALVAKVRALRGR